MITAWVIESFSEFDSTNTLMQSVFVATVIMIIASIPMLIYISFHDKRDAGAFGLYGILFVKLLKRIGIGRRQEKREL